MKNDILQNIKKNLHSFFSYPFSSCHCINLVNGYMKLCLIEGEMVLQIMIETEVACKTLELIGDKWWIQSQK